MLRSFSDLAGCTVGAMDGDLGGVRDVYFDDGTWTVRYLVVDTGEWLPGRRVLVSPMSIRNSDRRTLRVALTRTQVTHSPNVNTAKPVSRLDEIELSHYYGHPYYWVGPYRWGVTACPYPLAEKSPVVQEVPADPRQNGHQYLQNGTAVLGHAIQTEEGDIGRVEDVLVDDKAWAIRYMVVDAKNWWPGKKVFVSPEWLIHPTWDESTPLSCIVLAVPGGASNGRTAISPRPTVASRSSVGGAIQYRC
jgi:sporulation protein YlmC with PRC-barrel domain